MARYICRNCRFRVESSGKPDKCPYCDEKRMEKEPSADELLNNFEE